MPRIFQKFVDGSMPKIFEYFIFSSNFRDFKIFISRLNAANFRGNFESRNWQFSTFILKIRKDFTNYEKSLVISLNNIDVFNEKSYLTTKTRIWVNVIEVKIWIRKMNIDWNMIGDHLWHADALMWHMWHITNV